MTSRKHTKQAQGIPSSAKVVAFEIKDWHCVTLFIVLVLVFYRDLLLGKAFLWEDFLYYSYPVRNFAATSMAMGQMPLWNPYTFSGMPLYADILSTMFYLPCALLALFVHDGKFGAYWLQLIVVLHYVLAGVSMFYLARSFNLERLSGLFAGVSYMLTGFMVVHVIHHPVVTLAAWIPLIVLLFRRVLLDPNWKWVFVAALVLGHSVLAGFPQLSLYIYVFLFGFYGFELLTAHKGEAIFSRNAILMTLRAGCTVLLSVAVAAVQLLPTSELSKYSERAQVSYEFASEGSLAWSQLWTLLFPKFFGSSGPGAYNYWGPGTYWYYWETCIYVGVLPLLLTVLSILLWRRSRYVPFLWGCAIFALLFAVGKNLFLHRLFFDYVPGFSQFRNPARVGILVGLAFALLSGFTIQHLLYDDRTKQQKTALQRLTLAVVGVGLGFWVLVHAGFLDSAFAFLKQPQIMTAVTKELNSSLMFLLISGSLVLGGLWKSSWLKWLGMGFVTLLFIDVYVFGESQSKGALDPEEYFARSAPIVNFVRQESAADVFRINARNADGMIMDRNQGMVDRVFMTEGYAPLALQRKSAPVASDKSLDLFNVKYKTITDKQSSRLSLAPNPTYLPRAFFVYDLHIANNKEELFSYLKSAEFKHRTTAVLEKDPQRELVAPTSQPVWKTRIAAYENNSITVETETDYDGFMVLSEIFYPGWRAYVDGNETEVFATDYSLRGLFVPKGAHIVEMQFRPAPLIYGGLITISALLVCGVGLIISTTRLKKQPRVTTFN